MDKLPHSTNAPEISVKHASWMAPGLVLLLAACASPQPRDQGRRPPPPPDGVPAAECLLKPFAGPDGALTRAALDAGIAGAFVSADADGDGRLSEAEVRRFNAARAGSCDRSPLIDWSGAGYVDRTAFAARYVTAFETADADMNGVVDAGEFARAANPGRARPREAPTQIDQPRR